MTYGMTPGQAETLARQAAGAGRESLTGLPVDQDWHRAKVYEPAQPGGHRAIVMIMRMPAVFWRVTCPGLGIDLMTGSGTESGVLATAIAEAIADGMLTPAHDVKEA